MHWYLPSFPEWRQGWIIVGPDDLATAPHPSNILLAACVLPQVLQRLLPACNVAVVIYYVTVVVSGYWELKDVSNKLNLLRSNE